MLYEVVGHKKDVWIELDPDTGVHRETMPPQTSESCPVGQKKIFIGRTEYRVDMVDTKHAGRFWNVTFTDWSAHLRPRTAIFVYHH